MTYFETFIKKTKKEYKYYRVNEYSGNIGNMVTVGDNSPKQQGKVCYHNCYHTVTQGDKSELLREISKLFDDLGKPTNSAKRYWLQVWLKNKRYSQVQSGKEMSREQLLELKADIEEVLNC